MHDILQSKIDLAASRLKPYEGFIFLCGGPTDVTSMLPVSIRDAIQRELVKDTAISKRLRVAEDYNDWSHDSTYRDLVTFEQHLAALSSVVVLVLESPGSIAELGLFSAIAGFQQKLLVVIERGYYTSESFIRLGPVDYLEKTHSNQAECHSWISVTGKRAAFDAQAAENLRSDLAEAVRIRANKPTIERALNTKDWLDRALLLCDFLSLYSALTIREIVEVFEAFDCGATQEEIRQTLYILEKVNLISMEPKGAQRFYVGIDSRQFVRFHLVESGFDLERFRTDQMSAYFHQDKKRYMAIHEARRRSIRA